MKNLFRIKVSRPVEILLISSVIVTIIVGTCTTACEETNKAHWQRVHDPNPRDTILPALIHK